MRELLWLTRYGPEGASSRYRAYQFASPLEAAGWQSLFEPMVPWRAGGLARVSGLARRSFRLGRLRGAVGAGGVVVVQKEPLMPPSAFVALAGLIRSPRVPVLWDVDDAVWLGRAGAAAMTRRMCGLADVVVAGNHLIAERLAGWGADTVVIPTCYTPSASLDRTDRGDDPRLLWIGSPATAPLLAPYAAVLEDALAAIPSLRMEFIGGDPPTEIAGHARVEVTPWSPSAELEGLRRAHFGLALQPRDPYADHKCGFKLVQYLSAGLVPIASDGPVHREIVGSTGLLVGERTDGAIVERLGVAPTPAEVEAALSRWEQHYSLDRGASAWAEVLSGR